MSIKIDCDFPGGNIIVKKQQDNEFWLEHDLRDTEGDWFYWCFRVSNAGGQTLRFNLPEGKTSDLGPAISTDMGKSWFWGGLDKEREASFNWTFPENSGPVMFGMSMTYTEASLKRFLEKHASSPLLKQDVLCKTRKGRDVELLHMGKLSGQPDCMIILTCRNHCCEMMASYVLEGIIEETLTSDAGYAEWLREHAAFFIVPFVDKDGVEDGDQGKNRKPHDHNRDYGKETIYPEVKAIKEAGKGWADELPKYAMDIHCPYIRGQYNDSIYMVGSRDPQRWQEQQEFGKLVEEFNKGIPYKEANNLPFGQAWNINSNYGDYMSCSRWTASLPGIKLSTSFEIPYSLASGTEVNAESAREFGRSLVPALHEYINSSLSNS